MASPLKPTLIALTLLLGTTAGALAQHAAATGSTAPTAPASSPNGGSTALPPGGVPGAASIGGPGTPPAAIEGKPGMSTPGANKP